MILQFFRVFIISLLTVLIAKVASAQDMSRLTPKEQEKVQRESKRLRQEREKQIAENNLSILRSDVNYKRIYAMCSGGLLDNVKHQLGINYSVEGSEEKVNGFAIDSAWMIGGAAIGDFDKISELLSEVVNVIMNMGVTDRHTIGAAVNAVAEKYRNAIKNPYLQKAIFGATVDQLSTYASSYHEDISYAQAMQKPQNALLRVLWNTSLYISNKFDRSASWVTGKVKSHVEKPFEPFNFKSRLNQLLESEAYMQAMSDCYGDDLNSQSGFTFAMVMSDVAGKAAAIAGVAKIGAVISESLATIRWMMANRFLINRANLSILAKYTFKFGKHEMVLAKITYEQAVAAYGYVVPRLGAAAKSLVLTGAIMRAYVTIRQKLAEENIDSSKLEEEINRTPEMKVLGRVDQRHLLFITAVKQQIQAIDEELKKNPNMDAAQQNKLKERRVALWTALKDLESVS